MSEPPGESEKIVRRFRQILVWPLQLTPQTGAAAKATWVALRASTDTHPWREVEDEFGCDPTEFQQRHYSEFVTFLPYVRRFLYGEGRAGNEEGLPATESPIRVFRRHDVKQVRVCHQGLADKITFDIAHVDLYFFFDIDVVVLAVEIAADDLPLDRAEDTMYRFGRAFPSWWQRDDGSGDAKGGHCVNTCEWLDAGGNVLSLSDYGNRSGYLSYVHAHRAPRFASHWEFLLQPLVPDHADLPGALRYRQVEYARMPLLAWLAMDDARALSRADFVRLGLVTAPGTSTDLPYSERHVRDFEDRYCYDQFWNDRKTGHPGTRMMNCGHALAMVGDADDLFFVDAESGLLGQFRHQYFLLFLIAHFHKATLLMLSDRMADALNRLDIGDVESIKRFKLAIREQFETFLRFTHRYWFHEISDLPQVRELYRMTARFLGTDELYAEVKDRIEGMSDYLDSDALRRQANTVVRLTVVTTFGLIGTVATGFLGMNIFSLADRPALDRLLIFVAVLVPTMLLTFYSIHKSKRLSDFLETLSDERAPLGAKAGSLLDVWRRKD